jgi:POT family proton-dependent oligopeptide transporter
MSRLLHELFDKTVRPFIELAAAPRAIWYVIGAFVLDSFAYFGILTLMTTYLGHDLGWGDEYAGVTVSLFTMLITLAMLGVGSLAESFGLRRAILGGLMLAVLARAIYCLAPFAVGFSAALVIIGLLMTAASSGAIQPVCYSGVKQFTDEKTSSMGYAVIYAFMNLGIVLVGTLSAWVRPGVQKLIDNPFSKDPTFGFFTWLRGISISGVQAVNWLCCGVSLLALVLTFLLFTRKAEATRLRPEADKPAGDPTASWHERLIAYFTEGPFSNPRFLFFIFMLLPVQTLFAHQWLTMPVYVLRSYPKEVGDKMEWLVNWINPGIIFFGVPLFTAFTRRVNVYTMMVVGTLVSAAPTFLLCGGPNLGMLITYLVLFSIGEALWSARFMEYASELAPPGRVAQYMGLAQIPWLLAKGTTGFYSGYLLATYCPPDTPPADLHTGTLWLIYGIIAMTSPIGLWLARGWVMSGLHTVSGQKPDDPEKAAAE